MQNGREVAFDLAPLLVPSGPKIPHAAAKHMRAKLLRGVEGSVSAAAGVAPFQKIAAAVMHRAARFVELWTRAGQPPFLNGANALAKKISSFAFVDKSVQIIRGGTVVVVCWFVGIEHLFHSCNASDALDLAHFNSSKNNYKSKRNL